MTDKLIRMKIDAKIFWSRFDSLVERKYQTLGEFCQNTGISYNTLSTQRTRSSIPKLEQVLDMASVLGVSVDYLTTGADNLSPWIRHLTENKHLNDMAQKLTLCSPDQLRLIDGMFATWGIKLPEDNQNKVLA